MKKLLILICTVSILLVLSACGDKESDNIEPIETVNQQEDIDTSESLLESTTLEELDFSEGPNHPFPGKIAIITNSNSTNYEEHDTAVKNIAKYGEDKIIHKTWPISFMTEQDKMPEIVNELSKDPDIKAIIVNQAVPGTCKAFEQLQQERKDIFIVFVFPQDDYADCAEIADICLMPDDLGMGYAMVEQAYKLGAETFVHYSFPRHMAQIILRTRRSLMEERCNELGINFVDVTAIDPTSDSGITGTQQFVFEDVHRMVEKYGKNTAFFATNCSMQFPLIEAIVDAGAIYPQPCCPSPNHGLPILLNGQYESLEYDIITGNEALIDEITEALSEKDMLGRMSSWSEDPVYTMTNAAVEYTIRYLNGEAPREVDAEILRQIIVDNVGVEAYLTPYVGDYPYTENGNGKTYDNFLLLRMDYITFE